MTILYWTCRKLQMEFHMDTDRHFLGTPAFACDLWICYCCSHRDMTPPSVSLSTYSDWQHTATVHWEKDWWHRWMGSLLILCKGNTPFHSQRDIDLFQFIFNIEQSLYIGGRMLLQWLGKKQLVINCGTLSSSEEIQTPMMTIYHEKSSRERKSRTA